MSNVKQMIDGGSFWALAFVVFILCGVGHRLVRGRPGLQLWGLHLAALSLVVVVVLQIMQFGAPTASELLPTVLAGVLAGGLVLGPAWIVLGLLGFLCEQYRELSSAARLRADIRRREREERRQRKQRERAARQSQKQPVRDVRAEREAAEERRRNADATAENARRREDAIVACDLLYNLRAPDIGERFTREQFDEFVKKYMAADKGIDIVERRAAELQTLIQQHFEAVNPPTRFRDLSELTAWYEEQKQLIESLSVTDMDKADLYKKNFLMQLNDRYADLTHEILEKQ